MTIYHIIDHAGFGTIHRLLYPLCDTYKCHKVWTRKSSEEFIDQTQLTQILSDKDARLIVHSTGNLDPVCRKALVSFALSSGQGFLFLHTSYAYQQAKGRSNMVEVLLQLQQKYHYTVLTPSKEVAEQYRTFGITAIPVQLGIPGIGSKPYLSNYRNDLAQYYNKYVTTCSSEKEIYRYVKGIDRFLALSHNYHLESECLIAGIFLPSESVKTVRFNEDDFLNILYHSKAYIQMSRYEAYNLTAVWAKQFRIPTLVLGVEGTWSSMGQYALVSEAALIERLGQVINGTYPEKLISDCYYDSISRETLECFHLSLKEVLNLSKD